MEEPTPGRPDLYQGLGMEYWIEKWRPDPAPDAVRDLQIAQLYEFAAAVDDKEIRELVLPSLIQVMENRLKG